MNRIFLPPRSRAAAITKAASLQTYYTVQSLVDRPLIPDAYRAYAYFRWVDDRLDQDDLSQAARFAFLHRQQTLIEQCYQGACFPGLSPEEQMIAVLIEKDREITSGLYRYIEHMMAVMAFDAARRGRLIAQEELTRYAHNLATAVTDALHYFIGHNCPAPRSEARYLAATGAHIAHMLRDTFEDNEAGYFNIPREVLETHGITPHDVHHPAYRDWVRGRVRLARDCFQAGKAYLAQVVTPRCRLAGYAYIARFEWVLDVIERDGYLLRPEYAERKSLRAGIKMGMTALSLALTPAKAAAPPRQMKPSEAKL